MKFEYRTAGIDVYNAVAYVNRHGDLITYIGSDCVAFTEKDGFITEANWNPGEGVRLFYPGDKITITF